MKGVDRRQFQTSCRSVFNTLWFQGSMDEWIIFIFHLSGPVCTLDLMVWFRTLSEVHSLVSALRVICKFFIALGRSLREKPGAIF
ncbi:hypothetical protein T03_8334 [Trichinella britovi]|uniref:Uncharacterized protein n=1 Tax=Trichinella britovi TaxID=45882 RepID=A0A0V1CGM0_TRIBR|nr:hypothetical protein T03_8334 [Trichinella britovi]